MVAEEFLNLVGQFKLSTYIGVEDFADKLSFLFSVTFFILSLTIVTVKSYFFKPLACYIATNPSGMNFDNYVENYCWVHGTIPFLQGENIPQNPQDWIKAEAERKINYYQWVPFILGLQCIMFYIPRIIWQLICHNKTGTDLQNLVNEASMASNNAPEERKDTVERLARMIEDMLYQHRDYRQGKVAKIRRKVYDKFNFCVFSKHLGTWLVLSYMLIKCMYCVNAFGQLLLMKKFLGFNESISSFGYVVLDNMMSGKNWCNTGFFPRVTYCYIGGIAHLGAENNKYVAQCALPINMLNEKIYVFLWFWVLLVAICTAISIPLWFLRIVSLKSRNRFVKKFLSMSDNYDQSDKPLLNSFIREFLRHDGVFLIRMIFINAGDLITSDLVHRLWDIYKENYKNTDFRNSACLKSISIGNALRKGDKHSNSNDSIAKEPLNNFV